MRIVRFPSRPVAWLALAALLALAGCRDYALYRFHDARAKAPGGEIVAALRPTLRLFEQDGQDRGVESNPYTLVLTYYSPGPFHGIEVYGVTLTGTSPGNTIILPGTYNAAPGLSVAEKKYDAVISIAAPLKNHLLRHEAYDVAMRVTVYDMDDSAHRGTAALHLEPDYRTDRRSDILDAIFGR